MAVPDATVNFLLENTNQVLQNNPSLIPHVREIFQKLQRQLFNVKILLADFSRYNSDTKFVKQTAKEIGEILDEAEDAVDTYALRASDQNSRYWLPKALHHMVLRNPEKRIADITEKIKQINEDKPRSGFQVLQYQSTRRPSQTEAPVVEGDHLAGLEGPASEVADLLLLTKKTESLEVITIAGMSGLGKTTLARMVYENPVVEENFDVRAFVYVSRAFIRKRLLLQILESCSTSTDDDPDRMRRMDEVDLEKHVKTTLAGKKYLIVLDDVWMPEDWDKFKGAFPNNVDTRTQCRVLITTRNASVAEYANPRNSDSLYKLGFLNQEQSRELLRWKVFGHEDSRSKNLQYYEQRIASACDGLPLVILLVAGALVSDPHNIEWWKEVADTLNDARQATQMRRREYKNLVTQVIEIVYKYLPNHLKPCFLYLAMFPANFDIPVWKLVLLWISEGFIQPEPNKKPEDTAERYLKDLINRNLVMIGRKRSNGRIKTVVMLETHREFCKKEAEKENIFREINKSLSSSGDQCRRLCINNVDGLEYISEATPGKRLRSFLILLEDKWVEKRAVSRIRKTFRFLKVVEAESLAFTRLPTNFSTLVLLKYLAISLQFSTVPSTLSALKNLQTLIANTTTPFLDIKANIWEMPQFRHLHTNAPAILPSPVTKNQKPKKEAPSSKDIQTLCYVAPEICKPEVLDKTTKLKKLGIHGILATLVQEHDESTFKNQLTFLENLKLQNSDEHPMPSLLLGGLPRNLTKLTLEKTRLDWDNMSEVAKLEKLEVLKLKKDAFQGATWNAKECRFRALIHLYIGETDLVNWEEASSDQFPILTSVKLNGCDKLKAFPPGLANIPSLDSVVLHCTNKDVATSAKKFCEAFRLSVYPPSHG